MLDRLDHGIWFIIYPSSKVYHNVEVSDPSPARPVAGLTSASSSRGRGGLRPFGVSCPPHLAGMERCDVDLVVVGLDRFRLVIFGAYCVHGLTGHYTGPEKMACTWFGEVCSFCS